MESSSGGAFTENLEGFLEWVFSNRYQSLRFTFLEDAFYAPIAILKYLLVLILI